MQEAKTRRSNRARAEATRGALIAAARALFVAKGYAETATPEIVKAAKVTRGALYHHFADKADLFRAVVQQEAEAVARQIEADSADPEGPLEALMDGADAYFAAMAEPGRVQLLLRDGPAVLGFEAMTELDRITGGAELQEGLSYALAEAGLSERDLSTLTDLLSAAFDRAAMAVANGRPVADYSAAFRLIFTGMLSPPSS